VQDSAQQGNGVFHLLEQTGGLAACLNKKYFILCFQSSFNYVLKLLNKSNKKLLC